MKKGIRKGQLYKRGKRSLALLLSVCLIGTMIPVIARAESGNTNTGLCEHHTEHTAECGYVAPVEGHACEHVHDEECGYVEGSVGSPCAYVCDICKEEAEQGKTDIIPEENLTVQTQEQTTDKLITAWQWVDEEEYLDEETGNLALPGASEEMPAHFDDITALLPTQIQATVENAENTEAEAVAETITLGDWVCEDYPKDGAYSGSYTFNATLPEGYSLSEEAEALTVLVELGGAQQWNVTGVSYRSCDENGTNWTTATCTDAAEVTNADTAWGTSASDTWHVVNGTMTIGSSSSKIRISVSGNVHLILTDGCSLTINGGIEVADGNSLTIYGQTGDTGSLLIQNVDNGKAGIGSASNTKCGSITINGGKVNVAESGYNGAGIGSGSQGDSGTITINGGIVTATGYGYSAGIGGGERSSGGTITINGGTVTATGGKRDGAGIGGGEWGDGGTIAINGGTVTATGGTDGGAGIGGGTYAGGGSITINGGTVTATGGTDGGAGIGGGSGGASGAGGIGGTISISGGTVTATGGTKGGAGIGGGGYSSGTGGSGGNITISGGTVTATGGSSGGAGIGDGINGSGGTVAISNSFVMASSISDTSSQASWSGLIFNGEVGKVYGESFTISTDCTIPEGKTLVVAADQTISITETATFTNAGTIYNSGTFIGTVANSGTIHNAGSISGASGGTIKHYSISIEQTETSCQSATLTLKVNDTAFGESVTYTLSDGEANAVIENGNTLKVVDSGFGTPIPVTATFTVDGVSMTRTEDVTITGHDYDKDGFCKECDAYQPATKNTEDCYEIGNAGQLYWFADKVNNDNSNFGSAKAVLTADITVNSNLLNSLTFDSETEEVTNGTDFRSWTPIGKNIYPNIYSYTGTFDGNNKTVSGLYFNNTSSPYVGLFGYVGENGTVKNVGVVDSYFRGSACVGGVCGGNKGGIIENCYNEGNVTGSQNVAYVGGVCGDNQGGTITNCYNTGEVNGTSIVGGVCGSSYHVYDSSGQVTNQATITNCYNTGAVNITVTSTNNTEVYVGGVCAKGDGTITNCYYLEGTANGGINGVDVTGSAEVKTAVQFASGEVCYLLNSSSSEKPVWYQNIDLDGETADAYPVLDSNHGTVYYGYDDDACQTPKYSNSRLNAEPIHDYTNNNGFCIRCDAYEPATLTTDKYDIDGDDTKDDVYEISNAGQLYWFAALVNGTNGLTRNLGANAVLTADITVNTGDVANCGGTKQAGWKDWTPIGSYLVNYAGTFDGQNHTVSGLYFNDSNVNNVGLFGYIGTNSKISNVGVVDSYFCGKARVGGVCGSKYGTVENCYSASTVSGEEAVGGVCGSNYKGNLLNCYNTGAVNCLVSSGWYIGGVCGILNDGTIQNCYSTGTVSGSSTSVGGVCGQTQGTSANISNCYFDSSKCDKNAVGLIHNGTVEKTEGKTTNQFASGEVCYLLNDSTSENPVWYQRLNTDTYPNLDNMDSENRTVYVSVPCPSEFFNTSGQVVAHIFEKIDDTNHKCKVCGLETGHSTETLTYTADEDTNEITVKCGDECGKEYGTVTLSAPTEDLIYDGTAKAATVSDTVDGVDFSTSTAIAYKQGETTLSSAPKDAGTYTASITLGTGEGAATVSVEFTIGKATPELGTVSVTPLSDTLDTSQVVFNRTDTSVSGTFALTDVTKLQYGTYDYAYVFTPDDTDNYKPVTGTVSITVNDTIAPTADYQIGENGWKKFVNTISFGLFCKDYKTVEITYSDVNASGEPGSGVKTKQYYIANKELTEAEIEALQWNNYSDTISLDAKGVYFIYVKVEDNAGNSVVLNSEGIVIYADSALSPESMDYTYKENKDLEVQVTMNGNTFGKLTDGAGTEIAAENYTIDEAGKLTLKAAYLDTLNVGEYTYKVYMNPQGQTTDTVTLTYSFVVNIKACELTVTGATATARKYDTTNVVNITAVELNGIKGTDDVSVNTTSLTGTLTGANVGNYTSVTLPALTLTGTAAGNYTLVQPTGAVPTNVTISKADAAITIDTGKDSYSKTFGNADFTLSGISDTNTEADVQYAVTAGEDVVSASNGTVTILNAGTATITVSLPASTNYNAADSKTITVTVEKKSGYTVADINKSYLYSRDNAENIDLSKYLPSNCGTVSYGTPQVNEGLYTDGGQPEVSSDGKLSYTVKTGSVGDNGTIKVAVTTVNYVDFTITVNVNLTDKLPVSLKDGASVTLQNSILTYGQTLSTLAFNSAVFVNDGGNVVAGTLSWKTPDEKPNAGTTSATWVFTPDDEAYAAVEDTVAITVNKATPNVTALPTVTARTYHPTASLTNDDLVGGTVNVEGSWSWQSANIIPVVNNSGYVAVFTPTDSTNYETVTKTITVTVSKATPYIATAPTAAAITYGDTLGASTLNGGTVQYSDSDATTVSGSFAWKDNAVKPSVSDSNTTTYRLVFTPSDAVNYNTAETDITLTVNKADNAPNMPSSTMNVANSCTKVSDVTIPTGWVWQDADKNTALVVDTPVTATAVYNGADKGNYENETVSVSITRSECEHAHTEVRNAKESTCKETGYTGDTYCTDCGALLSTGTTIPLADHQGGTATCTKKAVCTVCGKEYGTLDANNHVHTEIKGAVAATCTAGGYTGDTYCTDCGVKIKTGTAIPAFGHNYTGKVTTEPTTDREGVRTYTCDRCGHSYTESIPKLPEETHEHSYSGSVTKEPTCTDTGVRTYTCSCGDSYTETIPALGHHYVSSVTKEPTTSSEGVMTYTCDRCGHSYTRAIAKLQDTNNNNPGENQPGAENKPDTGKPYIKDENGKEGWDVIKDEVDKTKDGDTVTVEMNGTSVVPGDVLDDIKGKDVTIVFDMGGGITWSVNGKSITADRVGDIDFTVKADTNTIPVDIINNVTGERYSKQISLSYDGEFGFTAVLSINMEASNAGLYANLFYYNEKTGEMEFICADEIAADGTAELTFTHASDYAIVIDKEPMEGSVQVDRPASESQDTETESTQTGAEVSNDAWNPWWIIVIGIMVIVIGLGVFLVAKKNKSDDE